MADAPPVDPVLLEVWQGAGTYPACGIGESVTTATPCAIANAVHNAIGVRVNELPLTPDKVLRAIGRIDDAAPGGAHGLGRARRCAMSDVRYRAPASLEAALELLCQGEGALPLAGGTDLFGALKDGIHADRGDVVLVDLKTVPGLDGVSVDDGDLVIGATTRLAEVVADELVAAHAPMLVQAAALVASPQLREMGTVGGNLCQEPRCWYYRYPGDVFHCHRKGGELCAAAVGDDRYHSIYGAARVIDPPCTNACPNGTAIPGYLELLRRHDVDAAARELLAANPLPAITGRICPHLCEAGCNRAELDEPVSIRNLERRVGDHVLAIRSSSSKVARRPTGKRVAVVGAGPAGLAAAFYLRRQGHDVTVIERETLGGGMLSLGIPPFRLDRDVVRDVLGLYERLGVEFRFGVEVGRGVTLDELRAAADAVVVAAGAWASPRIGIDGEERAVAGLDYLRQRLPSTTAGASAARFWSSVAATWPSTAP